MTLNKTEEEKMRGAFETWFSNAHPVPMGYNRKEDIREAWQAAIAHANTQHSKLLEDYDRIARVAEKQAEEIVKLHNAHVELERSYIERLSAASATIAMLRSLLIKLEYNEFGVKRFPSEDDVKIAISNTQATADAFMAEHDAKVLEGINLLLHALPNTSDGYEVGLVKVKYANGTLIDGPLWLTSDETDAILKNVK